MPTKHRNHARTDSTDETGHLIDSDNGQATVTPTHHRHHHRRHHHSQQHSGYQATSVIPDSEDIDVVDAAGANVELEPEPGLEPELEQSQGPPQSEASSQHPVEPAPPSEPLKPSGRKASLTSGGSSTNRSRCSSSRPPQQQKVVYYQNRFITIPAGPPAPRTGSRGTATSDNSHGTSKAPNGPSDGHSGRTPPCGRGPPTMNAIAADESSVTITMHSPDPGSCRTEIQTAGTSYGRGGHPPKKSNTSVFKKIAKFLQDNRGKGGSSETAQKLRTMNKTQNASNQQLKKVLNIIFVTIGVCLLVSVVIVIIYTAFVEHQPGVTKGKGIRTKRPVTSGQPHNRDVESMYDHMHESKQRNKTTVAAASPLVTESDMMYEYITVASPAVLPFGDKYDDNSDWSEVNDRGFSNWGDGYDDESVYRDDV